MTATETPPPASVESATCSVCGQETAAQHLRKVAERNVCCLCVTRMGEDAERGKARALDAKYHGGAGWLWKHIAAVAGLVLLRFALRFWNIWH